MNRLFVIFALGASLAVSCPVGAQFVPPSTVPTNSGSFAGAERASDLVTEPSGMGWALLDPSRFRMRQSYSISYFTGSGASGSVGLYLNNLEYQLFRPLTLRLGLGYMHQPFASRGANSEGVAIDNGFFIPSAGLEYRPSKNFLMTVEFRQFPAGASPYSRWGYGWSPYSSRIYDPRGW